MSSDGYNVEGNGGTNGKAADNDCNSTAEDGKPSLQARRLSIKLTNRWHNIQKNVVTTTKNFFVSEEHVKCQYIPDKYSHIFRHKSRWEHLKLSCAVCGIEFCYAAETAFVTPILLSLGLSIQYVTIIWCLSPLVGLILTPIFGSMSDSCQSKYGRRRPFIVLYSIGILLGLILVPSGHHIGLALGDIGHEHALNPRPTRLQTNKAGIIQAGMRTNLTSNSTAEQELQFIESNRYFRYATVNLSRTSDQNNSFTRISLDNNTEIFDEIYTDQLLSNNPGTNKIQPWSIVFTVIGVILLDFCADACQSPARTYLLDVSIPSEHASGLSTFTIMCGLGGSLGYVMGAIDWDRTVIGNFLGGHINAVFAINATIFILCLVVSLTSFTEIPMPLLRDPLINREYHEKMHRNPEDEFGKKLEIISYRLSVPNEFERKRYDSYVGIELNTDPNLKGDGHDAPKKIGESYRKLDGDFMNENVRDQNSCKDLDVSQSEKIKDTDEADGESENPKLKEYILSIFKMPKSLRILAFTNLLGWMSSICYSLYFTDFVGESVFKGDPHAKEDSLNYQTFQSGLQFGCWGLSLFCLSCGLYSLFVEQLVKRVGAKTVYIGGQLSYSVGMIITGLTKHKIAVILLSPTAGIMYCTVFTLPYFLLADYHSNNQFSKTKKLSANKSRGIGTDVAVISSMMFLAQFILSLTMGSVAEAVGSSAVPIFAAALLSACGALAATQVTYINI